MTPSRVIKDSIWNSPSLAMLLPYYQDQWPRWLLMADDWGCFNADPEVIKGHAYPKRKETVDKIIKIRDTFYNSGMLFIWTTTDLRTWGHFVNWEKHEYIGGTEYDRNGQRVRHRRKTPEPPQKELTEYLKSHALEHLGTSGSGLEQTTSIPIPIPIPIPNPLYSDEKRILRFWNGLSGWLKRRKLKGMRQSGCTYESSKRAESAVSQRLKEYGFKIVRQAIYNYYRMWLFPADQRRWTYTLWGLTEFCERSRDNIARFMDWDEVKTNFLVIKKKSLWDR